MTEKLDEIDLKILRILQNNSNKTTKEVAEMLNLTASPVYERIKKLENNYVWRFFLTFAYSNELFYSDDKNLVRTFLSQYVKTIFQTKYH